MYQLTHVFIYLLVSIQSCRQALAKPNILFIFADDYGYADVGFHNKGEGRRRISTPNIDNLAYSGVKLENYYVQPVCTPTRASFHTGRYPIRLGLHTGSIGAAAAYGLDPGLKTVADALRAVGYSTHAFGKWHLGFCSESYLPTSRGYDNFYGFLNGELDYYTHRRSQAVDGGEELEAYDYFHTVNGKMGVNWPQNGRRRKTWMVLEHYTRRRRKTSMVAENMDPEKPNCYSTHDITHQVIELVRSHPLTGPPLFIYLAFQATHDPLQVPSWYSDPYNASLGERALYAGQASALDEAVGNVTQVFKDKGANHSFWKNTLLIFSSDNGGNCNKKMGSNYPLRGSKGTIWEGGTRAAAFIHGYGLKKTGYSNYQMMHVVDWLPTLLHVFMADVGVDAVGVDLKRELGDILQDIDGMDVWDSVMNNKTSPRTHFVYNIEADGNTTEIINGGVRRDCYKLMLGKHKYSYHWDTLAEMIEDGDDDDTIDDRPRMFNICDDPSEKRNLYGNETFMDYQSALEELLEDYRKDMIPAIDAKLPGHKVKEPQLSRVRKDGAWGAWGCDTSFHKSMQSERQKNMAQSRRRRRRRRRRARRRRRRRQQTTAQMLLSIKEKGHRSLRKQTSFNGGQLATG